jgi:WD40 repeat protein
MSFREGSPVPFGLLKAASPCHVFLPPGASRTGAITKAGLLLLFALSWGAFGQPIGKYYQTLEALAADSELVVVGTIASVEDTNQPLSLDRLDAVKFSVKECFKGESSKTLHFVVPRSRWPDRELSNWVTSKTPLLVFLSESARLGSRQVSRFRYAPLKRDAVVDLSSNAPPELLTLDYQPVRGAAAILAHAKTAVEATKSGAYNIVSTNVPLDRIPSGYWASWVGLSIPVRRAPGTVLRPDLSPRFTPKAQYDGNRILAARGKDAFLWDAATGKLIRKFTGSAEEVQAVTFCPVGPFSPPKGEILTGSGKRGGILGGSKDNGIRLWNVEDGAVKKLFGPLMGPVMALAWAPDARRFISSSIESSDHYARRQRLWEDFGATELFVFPGYDPHCSPDGAMVVCRNYEYGGVTSFVGVWDAQTFLQLCTLSGENKTFYSAKLSPYGNRLVTTATASDGLNYTHVVEVWDAETGRHLLDLKGAPRAFDAAYTHDGTTILTAANRSAVVGVWNAESGELVRTLDCGRQLHTMLLSPDGQRCLATWGPGRYFGNVEGASLWDIQTGKELLRMNGNAEGLVGFAADGATIFAFDNADGTTGTIWSAETGKVLRTIRLE